MDVLAPWVCSGCNRKYNDFDFESIREGFINRTLPFKTVHRSFDRHDFLWGPGGLRWYCWYCLRKRGISEVYTVHGCKKDPQAS